MNKIYGKPVYWMSPNKNVSVTYNVFGMGSKYSIYRKRIYETGAFWEYVISFTFVGEAISYAKKIIDVALLDQGDLCENT